MTTIDQIKQELRGIIELSDKATPGPWEDDGCGHMWHPYPHPEPVNGYEGEHITLGRFDQKDFFFITASRNLTPKMARALLGMIEALQHDEVNDAYITRQRATYRLEAIRREWEGES